MYDIVSELNASKTQVFECKQDCGRYLSFHCHMQSHSCEFCSCICFTCLSTKTSHTTSTTAGIDVPAINTSGTATDVMTTADDSPAITEYIECLLYLTKLSAKLNLVFFPTGLLTFTVV